MNYYCYSCHQWKHESEFKIDKDKVQQPCKECDARFKGKNESIY